MRQVIQELKRRNVIKVAIAYAVSAWLLIEVTDTIFPILGLPDWSVTLVTALLLVGFPIALIFAWAFELTPEGIKREENLDRPAPVTRRFSSNAGINKLAEANPLLRPIWPYIDDELKNILVVAATLAQLESKRYVSTTNFVKALMVAQPGQITEFFNKLPQGALPEASPTDVPVRSASLASLESFSPCINSALSNLTPEVTTDEKLSSEDVYIDIARHATGKSTQLLRSRGVSESDVEDIVSQLGWHLVERRSATAD